MIQLNCPHCGNILSIPDEYAGQSGTCKHCGNRIVAPGRERRQPEGGPAPLKTRIPLQMGGNDLSKAVTWGFGVGCGCLLLAVAVVLALTSLTALGIGGAANEIQKSTGGGRSKSTERTNAPPAHELATLSEFNRLLSGMRYEQVVSIIGSEGTVSSSYTIPAIPGVSPETTTTMYSWEGAGGFGANMNATFQNGILQSKAQFGLE